jgi:hypothetical protein
VDASSVSDWGVLCWAIEAYIRVSSDYIGLLGDSESEKSGFIYLYLSRGVLSVSCSADEQNEYWHCSTAENVGSTVTLFESGLPNRVP